MSVIISLRSLSTERKLERTVGLQPLRIMLPIIERIPEDYRSDFYICPMAFNGCEGAKDPEFYGRCAGSNYPYMNCDLWDGDLTLAQKKHEEDGDRRVKLTKNHIAENSIHDALAEGIDLGRVAGFPFILDQRNFGRACEYDLRR